MNIYEQIYDSFTRQDYEAAAGYITELKKQDAIEAAQLKISLYIEQGDSVQAMTAWQELYKILPNDFFTSFLHARIRFMEGRYVSAYKEIKGIVVPPNKQMGYGEKIANLLGQCCRILGKNQEAAAAYKHAAELASEPALQALEYSNYLFNLHYSGRHRADFLREQASVFGQLVKQAQPFRHVRKKQRAKLRIGYISADFRRHVCLCFCYDLLTAYDRDTFEVYVYMLGREDEYSYSLQKQVTAWRNLQGLPAQRSAQIIYEDEIDILVDLAGHTKGNGLPIMAYKPAPVQVSGIGYFASTGLPEVDYFLGDIYLDGARGEKSQQEFCEKLVILPQSHFCYRPLREVPLPQTSPFRHNGYVTFGSFNNFAKVNDEVLITWCKILLAVPDSHLLLKAAVFDGGETETYMKKRMARLGLPMERVECRGISADYLPEYGDMDIALDTFPYPGGGTSCDALYMGRPLITIAGSSHGERFGYSLLANMGLGELVTYSVADYIARAVLLASERELLQGLHNNLRNIMQKSALRDSTSYMQDIEEAYRQMRKD
ncbi:O-linked N-acetylglucosamine transferase, SPINDLY family protein [Selenomonas ruminantium]|uniref:Glycosyl transferase family 41 n=1 Tax=Selenomonas ruminantium TaxID=971 RepID=A0A1K1N973_SELRU|nr:hypothetical protein [Selenomonas ruminantium]SFW31884.1 Glycosyl transferase family 41 [Selenomonas ruminantium]